MKTTAPWGSNAAVDGRDERPQAGAPAPLAGDWLDAAVAPPEPVRDRSDEMRAIASELARLAERTGASEPGSAEAGESGEALRVAVAQIARRQADLDRNAGAPSPAAARHESPAIGLREDLLASVSSAPWATRPDDAPLERAPRTREPRARGGTDLAAEVSQTFARFGRDLREVIEGIDARPSVEALNREVRQIGRAVDGLGAGLPSADAIARIGEQTREVRDMLGSTSARAASRDAVDRHVAAPEGRLAGASAVPPDFATTMAEIRGLLEGFRPGATMARLDAQLETLTRRIEDGLGTGDTGGLLHGLSRRVDEIQSSLQAQLSAATPDTGPLQRLMDGLAERVSQAREASADFQRLEAAMREVAVQIGGAATGADPRTISSIEAQLTRVAERLERSEASLRAIDGVEQQIGDLFSQFEVTRQVTVEAAETAARTAARDTLRAALQNPLLVQRQPDGGPVIADQVARGLESLRTLQDQAERRTQNALADLRATVERLAQALNADEKATEAPRRERPAATPPVAPAADPSDLLIEPGLGRGAASPAAAPRALTDPVIAPEYDGAAQSPDGDGPASFIAAARRAAQAAQASAAAQKDAERRSAGVARDPASTAADAAPEGGTLGRARAFLAARRRPVLLGIAAVVVAVGALELVKLNLDSARAPRTAVAEIAIPVGGSPTAAVSATAAPEADAPPVSRLVSLGKEAVLPPASPPAGKQPLPTFVAGPATAAAAPPEGVSEGLRDQAAAGDAAAQYEVGLRYAEGRGVPRDSKQAAAWFDRAAEQGLAPAGYRLGSAYEKGVGVDRDAAQAVLWYTKAAEAGNVRAMHNLAVMSAEGSAGKSDYAKAAQWFEKASDEGVRDSQFNLAILYARGLGVEQSFEKSYMWFAIAAAAGDEDAAHKRDEVAPKLDAKQLAAAKAAADDFHAATPSAAANEVAPPPGGWDAAGRSSASGPAAAKVSQL